MEGEYEGEFTYLSTSAEDFSRITSQIRWKEDLRAPVRKGDVLGEQIYFLDEKEIGRSRILAREEVEKADFGYCPREKCGLLQILNVEK